MSKAKKLIEVAMPIKEISAESVRDKYIHHGHLSTLHIWWARRPLPVCRAAIFASLVPDPDDISCPDAFKDAVAYLLKKENPATELMYRPYKDIPYTAMVDPMDDTLRNRLMMFIGKFSDKCQQNMLEGKKTAQKDKLSDSSLIKWENKNNPIILGKARELIFVAYNAEKDPQKGFESLHREFQHLHGAVSAAEKELYSLINRHQSSPEVKRLEQNLQQTTEAFLKSMPSVFDPFAGGGAIPLEAARLGCRSYGNDINPVAHIIERSSAEFPQKYGKPIIFTKDEFIRQYGERGQRMLKEKDIQMLNNQVVIPNRLAWDVEFYSLQLLDETEREIGYIYPADEHGNKPVAYYWARTAICSNPACGAEVPMIKQLYLSNKTGKKIYLNPIINNNQISFELKEGICNTRGFIDGSMTCPCCGTITTAEQLKQQASDNKLGFRQMAVIEDTDGKSYQLPNRFNRMPAFELEEEFVPNEKMTVTSDLVSGRGWSITKWKELFTKRQLKVISTLTKNVKSLPINNGDAYNNVIITYLAILVDRIASFSTSFGRWIPQNEQLASPFGKQAIPMVYDFPEVNIFAKSTSGAYNQLEWILRFLESESQTSFVAYFKNASSGDQSQFDSKELTAVVTDPPYYDAMSYADLSDFFYVWMKQMLSNIYPINFATPVTPKAEECTALKAHHNNSEIEANRHFENKLSEILDAIERQTQDIVSIMFAHQSTKAWTTLCNSILTSRMNISGSWAIDTERDTRMIANEGAALESSVTVACRPNERKGFEEFKVVERAIKEKVEAEVEKLYELGFRGADLLTACFGQAVSEFGKYQVVEKANGDRVTVAELLDMARQTAYDTLLKGVKADELTRFYLGWLQMNGMGDADHDDVTQFTRVGVNVEIHDVIQEGLLVQNGNKNHLANAEEHLKQSVVPGTLASHPLIDQVHRAILLNRAQHIESLLKLIHDCAPSSDAQFWRVLAGLKESLPASCPDLKDVQELLRTADYLRTECKKDRSQQPTLFDNME